MTAKREYKLAAYPFTSPSGQDRREILEITDGHRSAILDVSNDDAMDVRDALARAYENGREDRGSEDEPVTLRRPDRLRGVQIGDGNVQSNTFGNRLPRR